MRTLEREREKRFQSAGEMKTNVEHLTEATAEKNGGLEEPRKRLPFPLLLRCGFFGSLNNFSKAHIKHVSHSQQGFQTRIPQFTFHETDHGAGESSFPGEHCHGEVPLLAFFPQNAGDVRRNFIDMAGQHIQPLLRKRIDRSGYYSDASFRRKVCVLNGEECSVRRGPKKSNSRSK